MPPSVVRVSALQLLSFGVVGAVYPFLALELRDAGVGGWVLLLALISAPVLRLSGGPLWGWASDWLGSTRAPLVLAGALSLAGTLSLWLLPGWLVVLGAVLLAIGRAGATPLVEATAVAAVDRDMGRYGNIRRWGSGGFMAAVVIAAVARDQLGVPPLLLASVLGGGFLVMSLGLPRAPRERPQVGTSGVGRLLRDPVVLLVLVTSSLHFAGIALYDGFFAVHLQQLGLGTSWLGLTIGLGIGTELVVLSFGAFLLRRLGASGLLIAAVAIHLLRWTITAMGTDPWLLVPIQIVHGFAFGGYWLASIALLTERSPNRLTGSVQGLLAASAGGVGSLIGNIVGTTVVERWPTASLFWVALAMTVIATGCAVAVAGLRGRPGAPVQGDGSDPQPA